MPKLPALLLLASLATLAFSSIAEEVACESVKKFKDGSSFGHSAKLTLANEKIVGLEVMSFNASGREGGGYICALDTSDTNTESTWSVSGATTKLEVITLDEKSLVTINRIGGSYVLHLDQVNRLYCGFGAEWPDSITISSGSKKCRVKE